MDKQYINLSCKGLDFQVKLDDEGVVVDIFEGDENVATTYKFYDEFGLEVKALNK